MTIDEALRVSEQHLDALIERELIRFEQQLAECETVDDGLRIEAVKRAHIKLLAWRREVLQAERDFIAADPEFFAGGVDEVQCVERPLSKAERTTH